jgi:uncharacterized protein YjbK
VAESEDGVCFLEAREEKKRKVWYLDTNDFKIRDKNLLLRIRRENDVEYVTSLKCRNPDRYIAAPYDLSRKNRKLKPNSRKTSLHHQQAIFLFQPHLRRRMSRT